MYLLRGALLLSLLLVAKPVNLGIHDQVKNAHPGAIVDAYSKSGILARAYAYGSREEKSTNDCPVYADQLDSQKSDSATGEFIFHIQTDKSGFLTVYCQQGYASRTETTNDNTKDGTRIQPDPIKLFPLQAKLPTVSLDKVAYVAIGTDLDRLRSNFRYFDNSSPNEFMTALNRDLAPGDRFVVEWLRQRPEPYLANVSPTIRSLDDYKVASTSIKTELDNVTSDFIYYKKANEAAFTAAESSFPSKDRQVIQSLKSRVPYWKGSRD